MHDCGLLLVHCRDDIIHIAAPVPKIEVIITYSLCFVKEIIVRPHGSRMKSRSNVQYISKERIIVFTFLTFTSNTHFLRCWKNL